LFKSESNHSTSIDKVVRVSHGHHGGVPKVFENLGKMLILAVADKQDLASSRLLRLLDVENVNRPGSDRFSTQCILEFSMEWIISQHAQDELGPSSGLGRPLHQLGEVKEKARLHAIFPDSGLRLNVLGNNCKEEEQKKAAIWNRRTSEDSGSAALARRAWNAIRYGTIHQQTPRSKRPRQLDLLWRQFASGGSFKMQVTFGMRPPFGDTSASLSARTSADFFSEGGLHQDDHAA
jgi:hypothetical protein